MLCRIESDTILQYFLASRRLFPLPFSCDSCIHPAITLEVGKVQSHCYLSHVDCLYISYQHRNVGHVRCAATSPSAASEISKFEISK